MVFCPLAPLQQEAYDRILELPEFQLMLRYSDPCKCGSGFKSGQCHGGWTSDVSNNINNFLKANQLIGYRVLKLKQCF